MVVVAPSATAGWGAMAYVDPKLSGAGPRQHVRVAEFRTQPCVYRLLVHFVGRLRPASLLRRLKYDGPIDICVERHLLFEGLVAGKRNGEVVRLAVQCMQLEVGVRNRASIESKEGLRRADVDGKGKPHALGTGRQRCAIWCIRIRPW